MRHAVGVAFITFFPFSLILKFDIRDGKGSVMYCETASL